jgi:hypothetical protein
MLSITIVVLSSLHNYTPNNFSYHYELFVPAAVTYPKSPQYFVNFGSGVESSQVQSIRVEPNRAEPSRVEPTTAESKWIEPSRVESSRVESSRVDLKKSMRLSGQDHNELRLDSISVLQSNIMNNSTKNKLSCLCRVRFFPTRLVFI